MWIVFSKSSWKGGHFNLKLYQFEVEIFDKPIGINKTHIYNSKRQQLPIHTHQQITLIRDLQTVRKTSDIPILLPLV